MKIPTAKREMYGVFKHLPIMNKKQFILFKKHMANVLKHSSKKAIRNLSTKIEILIDKSGVEHSLDLRGSVAKTKSMTVLREIIEVAGLADIKPDRSKPNKQVLNFVSIVIVDGQLWRILMVVKEGVKGNFYYHHDLTKFKKA